MCCSLYNPESANVDILTANKLGITVTGVRDYGDEGVAEYIIHELVEFLQGYKQLRWDTIGHEITNLKCGVIGLGVSGTLIAKTLKFFKADVSYYSRTRKPDLENEYGCEALPYSFSKYGFITSNASISNFVVAALSA